MLIVSPSSTCDVCLELYSLDENQPGGIRAPSAIDCGHVFCSRCIDSFTRLACPLCRSYYDPRAVRRLHVDMNPPSPDERNSHLDDLDTDERKEHLKSRLISMVRRGAEGVEFQTLLRDTSSWLKEQSADDHWDLRALYMLVVQYQRMYKEHQAAQMNLHTTTMKHEESTQKWQAQEVFLKDKIDEYGRMIDELQDDVISKEQQVADIDAQWSRKCDDLNEHIRTVERELWVHKARAERHDNRASGVRHKGSRPSVKDTVAEKPKVLDIDTSEAVTKPFNEDEEDDHFSPLPAHLSPFPVPATFSPIIKDISPSEEIDSRRAPRERRRDTRQDVEPTLDVTKDFSNYTHHSPTKPVSIGATAAHLMRYHDETTSENSTSLPHHAPASYLSKRQEKQREGASLSRNHSSGSSGTGRNSGSKLRQAVRLPEQAIPDSSDEAEVNARHSRRRWLDDLLADPAGGRPSSNLAGSPISAENMSIGDEAEVPPPPARAHRDNRERERERDRERERERDREPDPVPRRDREQTKSSSIYVNRPSAAYEPQSVPATSPSSRSSTPPPVLPRPTPISHASTAAQQFERERERRRRESGASSRGNGTPATEAPYGSLKDTTNASIYVADDAPPRRQPYPERRVSSDRQPPMQTKGWRNPGGLEA